MSTFPSPADQPYSVESSPYPSHSHPNHQRSTSRQSSTSTSSLRSIKRKPVPTEIDQLRQLGNEVIGGNSFSKKEEEEVLSDQARPNFLPHSNPSQGFHHSQASSSSYPPAPSPSALSRHTSTSSRPLSPPTHAPIASTSYSLQRPASLRSSVAPSSHASESVFGSPPQGIIGTTVPREIVRIERDYSSGTGTTQFWAGWIWELEGRVSPTVYQTILNDLNLILARAHDPSKSFGDNLLAILTFWISPMILTTHYEKEMKKFDECLQRVNREHLNPVGLNLLNPEKNAFLFLELEYY
ncbi:ERF4 family protein [Sporobolomyces salmoneus]|uniref:ERF4 family protein n=1 Tax=Sporobolomyces salmoneus TaxID=183962 RepID=UPI00316EF95D